MVNLGRRRKQEERFRVSLPPNRGIAFGESATVFTDSIFELARVPSDGNARSGVNELRPGPIVTNAAAYEGTEVQYFGKGDIVYLLRENTVTVFSRKTSVDCEKRRMHSERFAKESW